MKKVIISYILFELFELTVNWLINYISQNNMIITSLILDSILLAIFTFLYTRYNGELMYKNKIKYFISSITGILGGYIIILLISIISNPKYFSIYHPINEDMVITFILFIKNLIIFIVFYFIAYFTYRKKYIE